MAEIHDLGSALQSPTTMPRQPLETDTEVGGGTEVSGVYRHVSADGTVMRPSKEDPAMVFTRVGVSTTPRVPSACSPAAGA